MGDLPFSFPSQISNAMNNVGIRLSVGTMMKPSTRKQLGTINKKITGAKFKAKRIIPPWGSPVPFKANPSRSMVSGSSRKLAKSAPELKGMNYPPNDPTQWPVEPDFVGHTRAPDPFGITSQVRTNVNAAIEHAYTRAKYQ